MFCKLSKYCLAGWDSFETTTVSVMRTITNRRRDSSAIGEFIFPLDRNNYELLLDSNAAFSRRDLYVRHQKTACSAAGSGQQAPRRLGKAQRVANKRQGTPDGDDVNDVDYVPGGSR